MPPKAKITKEEILEGAYRLALENGIEKLSSRSVAHAVGCSIQPVFYHFPTMDALRQEVYNYACRHCAQEVLEDQSCQDLLTVMTRWMMDMATNSPNLFRLLYLSDLNSARTIPETLMRTENHQAMNRRIETFYGLSPADSEDLLVRSCILLMGIGTMVCINKMELPLEQVLDIMRRSVDDFIRGTKPPKASAS